MLSIYGTSSIPWEFLEVTATGSEIFLASFIFCCVMKFIKKKKNILFIHWGRGFVAGINCVYFCFLINSTEVES